MSIGNTAENDLLKLLFNNTTMALVGDATGIVGSASAGSLYVSLHTGDPGEAGLQTTSEATYGSYARVAVARSGAGWTVTNNSVVPAAEIAFPAATSGTEIITHCAIGTASSGAGKVLASGAVTPNISVSSGVTPKLTVATAFTLE